MLGLVLLAIGFGLLMGAYEVMPAPACRVPGELTGLVLVLVPALGGFLLGAGGLVLWVEVWTG